jgi:nickel-dependent lactate racemase
VFCLGNLEFHYFAGFSGEAKAILPGCASRAAVTASHSMMVHHEAPAGRLERNPVRTDIEEAGAMLGVGFLLNVLLDDIAGICRIIRASLGTMVGISFDAHNLSSFRLR